MVDCSSVSHQVIYPLEEVTQAAGFHAADLAIGWLRENLLRSCDLAPVPLACLGANAYPESPTETRFLFRQAER